jgi:hypothetical protein
MADSFEDIQMHPGKSDCVKESTENNNSGILARFQFEL